MPELLVDARGVVIEPGDTVIYGFGVGRSVAMAEGVVLGEYDIDMKQSPEGELSATQTPVVSLTPSGRVRLRVVRRSYGGGEKPVVDIAPDRVVVLKAVEDFRGDTAVRLPPSPLPTQDEENRDALVAHIEREKRTIAEIERTGEVPEIWHDRTPEYVIGRYRHWLAGAETKLADVERRLGVDAAEE